MHDILRAGPYQCRLCRSTNVDLVRETNVTKALESANFRITDSSYGLMLSIFKCRDCGFMQCLDVPDTTQYYRDLEDADYETGRKERIYQSRRILKKIVKTTGSECSGTRLLDIGAGSGILLEAAAEMGFHAEGVEPSDWLRSVANSHGCSIKADVIPHPDILGPYDIITMIDVIEHVSAPYEMTENAFRLLRPGGVIAVVTPDVRSLAARIMGWKWWHYRIAHVGYFNKTNLKSLFDKIGIELISISRPSWSFSIAYIRDRLVRYLPSSLVLSEKQWMHRIRINLNLLDSLMFVGRRPWRS